MTYAHLKPAVPKCWLFVVSGLMWSAVGLAMCAAGMGWLAREGLVRGTGFELAGLLLALLVARRVFSPMARKNIRRLRRLPARGCFFAFQAWKSYVIIMFMAALGIALRHSPILKTYLAVVYTTIGGALFLASLHYYRHLMRLMRTVSRRRLGGTTVD